MYGWCCSLKQTFTKSNLHHYIWGLLLVREAPEVSKTIHALGTFLDCLSEVIGKIILLVISYICTEKSLWKLLCWLGFWELQGAIQAPREGHPWFHSAVYHLIYNTSSQDMYKLNNSVKTFVGVLPSLWEHLKPNLQKGIHIWYCKPSQKFMVRS